MYRKLLVIFIFLTVFHLRGWSQCAAVFPYLQDFESDDGGWLPSGTFSDWAWGSPSKVRITQAGSGNKCWISGGLSNSAYNGGEKSWLQSPCFDFTLVQNPYISFLIYWDTERQYDGGNLQYSINGGLTWSNVGAFGDPSDCRNSNWYNSSFVNNLSGVSNPQNGWSGTTLNSSGNCLGGSGSGQWLSAKHCMANLTGISSVIFRFTFGTGTSCNNFDGIAIDSIYIGDAPTPSLDFIFNCIGGNAVEFTSLTNGCANSWSWNFGDSGSMNNSSINANDVHTYTGTGIFPVTLSMVHPCVNLLTVQKDVIFPDPIIQTTLVTCSDGSDASAIAIVNEVSNPLLIWNTIPLQYNDTISNLSAGSYTLTVSDPSVCSVTKSFSVEYGPDAFPDPDLGKDARICPGETVVITPGVFANYLWSDQSVTPEITIAKIGSYWVKIQNEKGCIGTDTIEIREGCGENAWIPSAFTPDDDGINEQFKVTGIDLQDFKLDVYDRWGQLIFTTENPEKGWDGTFNEELSPNGIYAYHVKYSLYTGDSFDRRGTVLLLR